MKNIIVFALIVLFGRVLWAHEGPRFWIGNVGGKVTTFTSDNDLDPSTFTPSRVFTQDFEEFLGIYSTEFPGYEVMPTPTAGVAPGTIFQFQLAGPLLLYESTSQTLKPSALVSPAPAPQLAVVTQFQSRVTNTGVQDGFDFFQYNTSGDHAHLSYSLYGNGTAPGGGADGAYVVPFRLKATTLATSDWYFLVLSKNASESQRNNSAAYAQRMADAPIGDANFDHAVNLADFTRLAAGFGSAGRWWGDGDFNFDGSINLADFTLLASNFGTQIPRGTSVPEPTVTVGASLSLVCVLRIRRKSIQLNHGRNI